MLILMVVRMDWTHSFSPVLKETLATMGDEVNFKEGVSLIRVGDCGTHVRRQQS